jgi:mycothiol synthase
MSLVRKARREDLESAVELMNEHSRRLHGADDVTPHDLLNYWESPDVDLEQDILLAETTEGEVVGYADVGVQGDHVWLDVRGTEPEALPGLLEAVEQRAAEKKPGARLMGYTSADDEPLRTLYETSGYELVRHSFRMRIDLDGDVPAPEWPAGFSVRTMREGDERRVYDAHMASFADTWMFTPEPLESWTHWFVKDAAFDPSLWFLAEAEDDLAGIVIARANENEPGLGWIRILGVIPIYRQRGLGQALLRHTFGEFARRGFDAVGLGVDAQNPTGAVRVYERAGMYVARTNLLFERSQG